MGVPIEVTAVHDGTTYRCGVSVHIFSSGVGDDVCSPFKRAAVDWCGKGVVYNQGHTVFVGHPGEAFYVEHVAARIRNGFAEKTFRVRTESGFDTFVVPFRIYKRAFDA